MIGKKHAQSGLSSSDAKKRHPYPFCCQLNQRLSGIIDKLPEKTSPLEADKPESLGTEENVHPLYEDMNC